MVATEPEPPDPAESPPVEWVPGTLVRGRFRIAARIGRGGMGEVYRAHDEEMLRTVALKVRRSALVNAAVEAKILAQLRHRNVVSVYEFMPGTPALVVMELAAGSSLDGRLAQWKAQGRPVEPETFSALARQIIAGLSACHERGVTHRDLKPQNILISEDGGALEVKLCDFGIASLCRRGSEESPTLRFSAVDTDTLCGSRCYMAPELWDGATPGPACDIYALGCVLYEILTGEPPFPDGPYVADLHRRRARPRPSRRVRWVGPQLDTLIARMLAIDPRERYSDAGSVAEALERAVAHVGARPVGIRWAVGGATMAAGGVAALLTLPRPSEPAPRAIAVDEPSEPVAAQWRVIPSGPVEVATTSSASSRSTAVAAAPSAARRRRSERPAVEPGEARARPTPPAEARTESPLAAIVEVAEGVLAANQRVILRFTAGEVQLERHNLHPSTQGVLKRQLAPHAARAVGLVLVCDGGRCTRAEE